VADARGGWRARGELLLLRLLLLLLLLRRLLLPRLPRLLLLPRLPRLLLPRLL
jgi:hypothetical protein